MPIPEETPEQTLAQTPYLPPELRSIILAFMAEARAAEKEAEYALWGAIYRDTERY